MAKARRGVNWTKLIAAILVCQIIGNIGTIFTLPALSTWYASLNKPFFNPPDWLFGPAWIILYTLIGIALYILWDRWPDLKKPVRKPALMAFVIQMALNPLWSFLFFGLRSPLYGFAEIILLWIAIVATISEFYKVSKSAGMILLPYILWVSFAALLNFSILILNFR